MRGCFRCYATAVSICLVSLLKSTITLLTYVDVLYVSRRLRSGPSSPDTTLYMHVYLQHTSCYSLKLHKLPWNYSLCFVFLEYPQSASCSFDVGLDTRHSSWGHATASNMRLVLPAEVVTVIADLSEGALVFLNVRDHA